MKDGSQTKVAIIIPTKDRPDFVVRLLNYYNSLNSLHPIYLADSSNEENFQKIKNEIARLGGRLNIHHKFFPPGDTIQCFVGLLKDVKEKYACYMGDDDFQVPDTLTNCVEFLENNPDYSSVIGLCLTFKIVGNGAFGEISETHNYPRFSIEHDSASERIFHFLSPRPSPPLNSVCRTEDLLNSFEKSFQIKDISFRGEILPSILIIISGKTKVIDKLGFVRQIHESHFELPDFYDWLTGNDWQKSLDSSIKIATKELAIKDKISPDLAGFNLKKAFWGFLSVLGPKYYNDFLVAQRPIRTKKEGLRSMAVSYLPFLKNWRRDFLRFFLKKTRLNYEVMRPASPYYADFEAIRKSTTKKI